MAPRGEQKEEAHMRLAIRVYAVVALVAMVALVAEEWSSPAGATYGGDWIDQVWLYIFGL